MARPSSYKKKLTAGLPSKLAYQETPQLITTAESSRQTSANSTLVTENVSTVPDIRIFQIYYEAWQQQLLDPTFTAWDNMQVQSELMEFEVFERLFSSAAIKKAELWGALSWRYNEKTRLTGTQLIKIIQANPGADVYYCNPHLANEALFHNAWLQGEVSHPQLLSLCTALFAALDWDPKELLSIHHSSSWSSANYFVGTSVFWENYLKFVREVLTIAESKLDVSLRNLLHAKSGDAKGLHGGATYIPFIIERLFQMFLKTSGKYLKKFKIDLPERERELNVHLKILRDMKDHAHQAESQWLAACWVNYRNLYLTQFYGRAWCQRYLRLITPTEIHFA